MTRRLWNLRRAGALAGLVLLTGGCAGISPPEEAMRRYPTAVTRGESLPIQAIVEERRLELTNVTGRDFGPSVIWLNQWYSASIDGMAVGETVSIPIARFVDEHGEQMRGGGFFATEAPERIVLAELRTGDVLRGMPVVEPNKTFR